MHDLWTGIFFCFQGNHAAVTDGELSDFMQSIWNGDVNAATDVRINLQSHTSTSSSIDRASGRYVHRNWKSGPCITFIASNPKAHI